MAAISLSSGELREIILGKAPYRKCPDCEGRGEVCYLEYALKERPHDSLFRDLSPQQAADFCVGDWPDYDYAEVVFGSECETCNAVGYISNLHD
jgi:hypothetical protein